MISAILITKNESKNILACLRSISWCDEIIIVDNFSRDGTAEFAKEFGAKVFQEEWKGYGAQKNSALLRARGDWILSIDADERVSPELKTEITDVLKREQRVHGYYIPRKNHFRGKWIRHGGWYPDYSLRLFRRGKGAFEERSVHEKVIVEGPLGYLRHPLIHYTYSSVSDFVIRMEKYSRLSCVEMQKSKKNYPFFLGVLRGIHTFFNMYLVRLGFLDGNDGLFLAISYSYYTVLKYYRNSKCDLSYPDLSHY